MTGFMDRSDRSRYPGCPVISGESELYYGEIRNHWPVIPGWNAFCKGQIIKINCFHSYSPVQSAYHIDDYHTWRIVPLSKWLMARVSAQPSHSEVAPTTAPRIFWSSSLPSDRGSRPTHHGQVFPQARRVSSMRFPQRSSRSAMAEISLAVEFCWLGFHKNIRRASVERHERHGSCGSYFQFAVAAVWSYNPQQVG